MYKLKLHIYERIIFAILFYLSLYLNVYFLLESNTNLNIVKDNIFFLNFNTYLKFTFLANSLKGINI